MYAYASYVASPLRTVVSSISACIHVFTFTRLLSIVLMGAYMCVAVAYVCVRARSLYDCMMIVWVA